MAETVPAEPKRLPHGNAGLLQAIFSAADADGAADIPEQVALLLNFLADLGKALLDLYRLIFPHVQQDGYAFFQQCSGIFICQSLHALPDDLQSMLHHQLVTVQMLRGV